MDPQSLTYRSPVYRKLLDLDAAFTEINGYAVATAIGDPATQDAAVHRLSLCDLSGLLRLGIRGPGSSHWVAEQGLAVPAASNQALRQEDGALLARLAANEVLILGHHDQQSLHIGRLIEALQSADLADAQRVFVVPRQDGHAWFRITGREAAATLAKLCAVDLRTGSFEHLQVAQTSVARLNAIVIRDDLADVPALHLLADSASAEYLWECLLDAGMEYGMRVVGLDALLELKQE